MRNFMSLRTSAHTGVEISAKSKNTHHENKDSRGKEIIVIRREIFSQNKTGQLQTYFVYFKADPAQVWGKRSATG